MIVLIVFSFATLSAQENSETTKQKDKKQMELDQKKLQKEKELQEKIMQIDKKKQKKELDSITVTAQEVSENELRILIDEQKKGQAEGEDLNENIFIRSPRDVRKVVRTRDGSNYSYSYSYGNAPKVFIGGSGDNTTFTISKKIKDATTFSSDFEYEVPENASGLNFSFGSELEAGSLKLIITKPNGKVFQVFSVAPVANVDWNKNLKIKDGESKDYSGTWKITISTKEAKGYYELKIVSF